MASSQSDTNLQLREWAPLTDLYSLIPSKINRVALFGQEVKMTCIDILPEFIAVGTSVGIVFWYDRKKKDIEQLQCESHNVPITSVKAVSSVDYMLACGNKKGEVSMFQIPKPHSDSLPTNLRPKTRGVERFAVSDLHTTPITALEWSKNGMKLFSGDKQGRVVYTSIEFDMSVCRSQEILNEGYDIVQLSYSQQKLLVCTTYRSIICHNIASCEMSQVGKKDRKTLWGFGGLIRQNTYKPKDMYLYCTRPGLRIWVADSAGNVEKTLMLKETLTKDVPEVPLINPISKNLRTLKPQTEASFGKLLPFNENLLVTYDNNVVYILDPQELNPKVLYTISYLRGVLDVATFNDEILILEEARSLIRVSYKPDKYYESPMYTSASLPLTKSLKGFASKIQEACIIPAIPTIVETNLTGPVNIHTDEMLVMNAEEALESPSEVNIQKKFEEIGKQEFNEQILYKKTKSRKKTATTKASTASISSNSSEDKDRAPLMTSNTVGLLPDLRSQESINKDIEYKEKVLFKNIMNTEKADPMLESVYIKDPFGEDARTYFASTSMESSRVAEDDKENSFTSVDSEQAKAGTAPANAVVPETRSKAKGDDDFPPACVNIPKEWEVDTIQIKEKTTEASVSDTSLGEWELL